MDPSLVRGRKPGRDGEAGSPAGAEQDHQQFPPYPVPPTQPSDLSQGSWLRFNADLLKYQKIIQFRDDYIQDLKNVNVPKEFKFTCQKALTTPLNAISDVTADHLKDKLIKLISIFDGKEVQATENTRFQATGNVQL